MTRLSPCLGNRLKRFKVWLAGIYNVNFFVVKHYSSVFNFDTLPKSLLAESEISKIILSMKVFLAVLSESNYLVQKNGQYNFLTLKVKTLCSVITFY